MASRFEILAAATFKNLDTIMYLKPRQLLPTFEAGDAYKKLTDLNMCTIAVTPASMFASVFKVLRAVAEPVTRPEQPRSNRRGTKTINAGSLSETKSFHNESDLLDNEGNTVKISLEHLSHPQHLRLSMPGRAANQQDDAPSPGAGNAVLVVGDGSTFDKVFGVLKAILGTSIR